MARAGRVVAETLALLGEHDPARRHDRRARRARRGVHPLAGRRRRPSRATAAIPPSICVSPNDDGRPRHPGPVRRSPTATSSRSTSASRSAASSPTPPTRSRSGRSPPEARAAARGRPGGARGRHRAVRGPGNALSDISHAVQTVTEEAGLLRRPQPRRPRRRALDARGPADPELRRSRAAARCSRRA